MFQAKVILKSTSSVNPQLPPLTTFQLRYPKFIHGEFMTHRVFSRNASSSRAIPTKKYLEEVRSNELRAAPIFWGKNQKGMQAAEEFSDEKKFGIHNDPNKTSELDWVKAKWEQAADSAAIIVEALANFGVHKQDVNRILEPFVHINVICTATEYDNFFGLRLNKAAQPEMRQLAICMWEAYSSSEAQELKPGNYHLPYVDMDIDGEAIFNASEHIPDFVDHQQTAIKVSVARCARVSHMSFETGKRSTVEEDLKLYDLLKAQGHWSPFEHQATPDYYGPRNAEDGSGPYEWRYPNEHGNLNGWRQYRKMQAGEAVAPLPDEFLPF